MVKARLTKELERMRHQLVIQSVVGAVKSVTDQILQKAGIKLQADGYTHDVAFGDGRANLLHASIARTSAVNCVKEYFLEQSAPVLKKFFRATDSRNLQPA